MIEGLLKELLSEKGSSWVGMLTSKLGFSTEQAEGFVPAALEKVVGLFSSGKVDVADGLDAGNILSKLDPGEIGKKVGVDADKAKEGLEGLIPNVVSSVEEKAGGADGLLSMLGKGGVGDAIGKLGKLF